VGKPKKAFYDKPTTKAKLIQLCDGSRPTLSALEVGAEFVGECVEIINDYVISGYPPGRRLVARTGVGSIFQDKPMAFNVLEEVEK